MTIGIVHELKNPRKPDYATIARCILKDLRTWFEIKGWKAVPRDRSRDNRLCWIADQASIAYPKDPKQAVRRECLRMSPDLSEHDIAKLIAHTEGSNKHWTPDHSAMVWGIGAHDRDRYQLWGFGACDDINFEWRIRRNLEKDAERKRIGRAARSSGRGRGRPRLNMTEEERRAHDKALAAKRQQKRRMSRFNPSAAIRKNTPDGLNRDAPRPPSPTPADRRRAHQASRSLHDVTGGDDDAILLITSPPISPARAPKSATGLPHDVTEDDGGCAMAPPPHQRALAI